MKTKSFKKVLAISVAAGLSIFAFQNCSVTHFSKDYSSVEMSSSISDSDGVFYTNSKTLPITVNISSSDFAEVRASIFEDMDTNGVEWIKLNGELHKDLLVDLGAQFAGDGSLDGQKTIFVESRDPVTNKVMKSQVTAYLDTQTPVMGRKGILEAGIQGLSFAKDQLASLEWTADDKVALSGFKSDIDPGKGFKWGVSNSSDCSESSLISKSEWGPHKLSMDVPWPSADALSAFYFCLYVRDRAGNTANLLSQPMTSQWNVVAGDNSQGNGSSVTSNKVRFKYIKTLFLDNDNNIQLSDSSFGVSRVIKSFENDHSRTIEQSQFNKNFPTVAVQSSAIRDSEGNYYFTSGYFVYRASANLMSATKIIKTDVQDIRIAIRKFQNVESLLVARTVMYTPNDPAAKDVLSEIPLSKIKEVTTTPISADDLLNVYRIAGNGIVTPSDYVIPASVKLSKTDSLTAPDNEHALGMITALLAGENGDIYVFTNCDTQRNWGNFTLRRLKQNDDGSFQQTVLIKNSNLYAPYQVAYKKAAWGPNPHELIMLAQPAGALVIDLFDNKMTRPFPELTPGWGTGLILVPTTDGKDYEIYIASANRSKLFRYDSNYKLIEGLGREISDVDVNNALASVLGNPDGLLQDPDNNIYLADSQNGVLQKISPDGKMQLVFGTYAANSSFLNGYTFRLVGDFQKDKNRAVIYSSNNFGNTSQLFVHDLIADTHTPLYPTSASGDPNVKYDWTISSAAIVKGQDDKSTMLISRGYYQLATNAWHTGYTGYIESLNLNGTVADTASRSVFAGDLLKGRADMPTLKPGVFNNTEVFFQAQGAAKIVTDSLNNIFSSSNFLMYSRLDQTTSRLISLSLGGAFTVVEDAATPSLRHIIYPRGGSISDTVIDLTNINDPLVDPVVKVNNRTANSLCIPGGDLRGVRDIIKDNEGNLLVSDSSNARVLKYRIRDSAGHLKLNYCN